MSYSLRTNDIYYSYKNMIGSQAILVFSTCIISFGLI